jgi:riboflavin synthase
MLMEGCVSGDSISVAGVCLTMLAADESGFAADLSVETLDLTSLGDRQPGDRLNLELALRASDRLGGHLVSGHVDGLARLVSRNIDGRSERFLFETEKKLARYIAEKGSVCLDGVSLTVNVVDDNRFSVCIIPHTLEVTTLGELQAGQAANLEVDQLARYLERLNQYGHTARNERNEIE